MSDRDELEASRARLARAAIAERRDIERALHDGVQQDLIAISVQLQLVRELVARDDAAVLEALEELRQQTADALGRIRSLAANVYPALLDARGLGDALREATHGGGVRAHIDLGGVRRAPPDVEAAAFFCCRAVLDRAAAGAAVTIDVRKDDGTVRIEIESDDDAGFVESRDVAEAMGGQVTVETSGGHSRLRATIPSI